MSSEGPPASTAAPPTEPSLAEAPSGPAPAPASAAAKEEPSAVTGETAGQPSSQHEDDTAPGAGAARAQEGPPGGDQEEGDREHSHDLDATGVDLQGGGTKDAADEDTTTSETAKTTDTVEAPRTETETASVHVQEDDGTLDVRKDTGRKLDEVGGAPADDVPTPSLRTASSSDPLGAIPSSPSRPSEVLPPLADSPAPSLPSKPNTPRAPVPGALTRQHSLPPPPPPEKPSAEEVAKIAHAFGRDLSPAATPSPRRSIDKALPPTTDDSTSGAEAGPSSGAGPSTATAGPHAPLGSPGIRAGRGPPPTGPPPDEIPFDFNRFLEQMRHRSAVPVGEYVRSFIRGFSKKPYRVADQTRLIFDFLSFITDKMREAEVWANSTPAEFDNATEAMEKLVMNRLYNLTFTPAVAREGKWAVQTDDLERDRIIKDRILLFSWIRPEHLDIATSEHTAGFVEFASQELLKMNNYKAPRDKLICILNCCKVIFGMIRHMATTESADSFVPALIYVVLKANPDNLVSNVEYISRFRSPERLSSESGYYLSSLAGAISFIESMDHTSLTGVTQEEMERNVDAAVTALALAAPPSPPRSRSSLSVSGSSSPFAEEGARTLQSLAPIAASLADDTRQFLQRTSEAARAGLAGGLGRPLGSLGNLFKEGLDGIRTPSPSAGRSSSEQQPTPRSSSGSGPAAPER